MSETNNQTLPHSLFIDKKFSSGFFNARKIKKEIRELFQKTGNTLFDLSTAKEKILDIGFGETSELYTLSQHHPGASIVGMDVFKSSMKTISRELKDIPTISAMNGDINALDFEDDYFDVVYLLNSLYFANDIEVVLKKIFSMLTKKGICVVELDITDTLHSKQMQTYDKHEIQYQKINIQQLSNQLEKVGFKESMQYKTAADREMILARKK